MCYSCSSRKFFIIARIYDKRGRLLSCGTNSYVRTHTGFNRVARLVGKSAKEYIHAEFLALHRLKYTDINRAYKICIYRFHEDGRPALAKPCDVCARFIEDYGIKHVYYTTDDNTLDMDYGEYISERERAKFWIR